MLAVTHCLVLGFFASIMIGAVQQMLPVLAGAVIPRPRLIAGIIWCQWVPAVLCLVAAFLYPRSWLFLGAAILASGALLAFLSAVIVAVAASDSRSDSVPGIHLAVFSLLVTLVLGILLAAGSTGFLPLWRPMITDLHLSWGLVGWIAVLVMSIAWQVVPLFQITEPYPRWFRRSLVPVVFLLLCGKSLLVLTGNGDTPAQAFTDLLLALVLLCFALLTLRLQIHTRRRVRDNHRDFWRLAMLHLIAVCLCWVAAEITANPLLDLLTAALFLLGFAMAVVTGMLLKIISFLIWLHLSEASNALVMSGKAGFQVPKMKSVISNRSGDSLLILLILAQVLLVLAIVYPALFRVPATISWLIYFLMLGAVLAHALLRYRRIAASAS